MKDYFIPKEGVAKQPKWKQNPWKEHRISEDERGASVIPYDL